MADNLINLKDDKTTIETRKKINELRAINTELRRKTKNKGLPINKRDDLFAEIDANQEQIEELLRSMKSPCIVPVTGTKPISEHNYEQESQFKDGSFRL